VYGGGSTGLMGVLSKAVSETGTKVISIIPESLAAVSGKSQGEVIQVKSMHERKMLMNQYADAFIALPGGFGTMEELVETITWAQLNIHHKPSKLYQISIFFFLFFFNFLTKAIILLLKFFFFCIIYF